MSTARTSGSQRLVDSANLSTLRHQYGCAPVEFAGTEDGLYERHLLFDDVMHPTLAARENALRLCGLGATSMSRAAKIKRR